MRVTALASGSSGNAYLIQTSHVAVLVDAGPTLAALAPVLAAEGVGTEGLSAVLVTHEHADHLTSAAAVARRFKAPLLATEGTLARVKAQRAPRESILPEVAFAVGDLRVTPFSLPHDGADPVGFLFDDGTARVALATDLGHVPAELPSVLRACDLLIVEANHDLGRLWEGPYSRPLKERVASPVGHLSNDQTGECLVQSASGRPQWVWLAHLSEVNNSPRRALYTVKRRLAEAGVGTMQVEVALRDRRSVSWSERQSYFQGQLL